MSQNCGAGIEYQENVSFGEFFEAKLFEAMDALPKNSVALIRTAEDDPNHNYYTSTFNCYHPFFFQLFSVCMHATLILFQSAHIVGAAHQLEVA